MSSWRHTKSHQYQERQKNQLRTQTENALVAAYQNAPTKSLETQILSIYAPKYTAKELKLFHSDFEQLSDRQIKKAKAHAKTLGAGTDLTENHTPPDANRSIQARPFFDIS